MKLDFIPNINAYKESVVRLYEFDKSQAIKFRDAVHQSMIIDKKQLDLASLNFIQARNCNLSLCISDEDMGIIRANKVQFLCCLTINGYTQMLSLLEPFCNKETKGYQYLYDIDNPIDFLFSPGGTW